MFPARPCAPLGAEIFFRPVWFSELGRSLVALVHKFVCRGTVEQRIHSLLEEKQALASELSARNTAIRTCQRLRWENAKFVSLAAKSGINES